MTCIWHNSDLGTRFDYNLFIERDSCFFHSIFNTHGYITRLYMHCIVGILDLCTSCHDHTLANINLKAQLCSSMLIILLLFLSIEKTIFVFVLAYALALALAFTFALVLVFVPVSVFIFVQVFIFLFIYGFVFIFVFALKYELIFVMIDL